jgi:myosin heavy subunit
MLRGASVKDRADFLLEDFKNYNYLSNQYLAINGLDEVEEYNSTIKAMHIMGVSTDDIVCKFLLQKQRPHFDDSVF